MELFGWILSIIAIIGTWLTIKKDYRGFILYSISNMGWILFGIVNEVYSQVFLFTCFLFSSIYGWWEWKKS